VHALEPLRERDAWPIGEILRTNDLGAVLPGRTPVGVAAVVGVAGKFGVRAGGGARAVVLVERGREGFAGGEFDVGLDEMLAGLVAVVVVFGVFGRSAAGFLLPWDCSCGEGGDQRGGESSPASLVEEAGSGGWVGHHFLFIMTGGR